MCHCFIPTKMAGCFFTPSCTHLLLKLLCAYTTTLNFKAAKNQNGGSWNHVGIYHKLRRAKQCRAHGNMSCLIWILKHHQVATFQLPAHGLVVDWIATWRFCCNSLQNNWWHCTSVWQGRLLSTGRPWCDGSWTAGVREKNWSSYVRHSGMQLGSDYGAMLLKRASLQESMFIQAPWTKVLVIPSTKKSQTLRKLVNIHVQCSNANGIRTYFKGNLATLICVKGLEKTSQSTQQVIAKIILPSCIISRI